MMLPLVQGDLTPPPPSESAGLRRAVVLWNHTIAEMTAEQVKHQQWREALELAEPGALRFYTDLRGFLQAEIDRYTRNVANAEAELAGRRVAA